MKLLTKSILYYLVVIVPLLIIAGILTFFLINRAVEESTDEALWTEKRKAERLLDTFAVQSKLYLSFDLLSSIQKDSTLNKGYKFSDAIKMDPSGDDALKFRILRSYYKSKGVNYLITVNRSVIEEEDLIDNLTQSLALIALFVVFAFFMVNWLVSKKLWKPFYNTLGQLTRYDIKHNEELSFGNTSTKEFRQLNEAVKKMTKKIKKDFELQKEFTENASHETQTPLAVIKARVDLLMQSNNLKENEMQQLQVIENAVSKLTSLNKALLLLTKIENHQFKETEEINLEKVVNKTLAIYEDVITAKNISVKENKTGDLKLNMNPVLAEILVGNLIQNAIRHNFSGGKIVIEISNNQFAITNTGSPLNIEVSQLFERFKKNDASKESLGLGLSIVKSIADACNLKINYSYVDNHHNFVITV